MKFKLFVYLKLVATGAIVANALLCVPSANAGGNWSIGLSVPGVVVSEPSPAYYAPAPLYGPAPPAYYQPAPQVYYTPPPPVYYRPPPPPIYYRPAPTYYAPPAPVYYENDDRWRHGRRHERRWEDRDD